MPDDVFMRLPETEDIAKKRRADMTAVEFLAREFSGEGRELLAAALTEVVVEAYRRAADHIEMREERESCEDEDVRRELFTGRRCHAMEIRSLPTKVTHA